MGYDIITTDSVTYPDSGDVNYYTLSQSFPGRNLFYNWITRVVLASADILV